MKGKAVITKLNDIFLFGMFEGKNLELIIHIKPDYIEWNIKFNINFFIDPSLLPTIEKLEYRTKFSEIAIKVADAKWKKYLAQVKRENEIAEDNDYQHKVDY